MNDKAGNDYDLFALIELRVKARGWPFIRNDGIRFKMPYAIIEGPWGFANTTGDVETHDVEHNNILTAPRLTLADIVADPGPGWIARSNSFGEVRFDLADSGGVSVITSEDMIKDSTEDGACPHRLIGMDDDGASALAMIGRCRAVADLLTKLAEVKP